MSENKILNAFSVDVEGFVESNIQSFSIPPVYINKEAEIREIEENTNVLLQILSEAKISATFFFVGRLAKDTPGLIKVVAQNNHEIGCHNYEHVRIFGLTPEQFRENLEHAKKNLEDITGKKVIGFRAPDFSITKKTLWALDILQELGFEYDSSIYPVSIHDVYGIENIKPFIHRLENGLIEVPMSTFTFLGKKIQFGGGGYFRLYPLWLTKKLLQTNNVKNIPCIFYIHPYEVGPVIPRIKEISAIRKFRHYYNCKHGSERIQKLLQWADFGTIHEVINKVNL